MVGRAWWWRACVVLLVGSCDPPLRSMDAVGLGREGDLARARAWAAKVAHCAERLDSPDFVDEDSCFTRQARVEVVGHVPPVVGEGVVPSAVTRLTYVLQMSDPSIRYRPTTVSVAGGAAVVTGVATREVARPVAAALELAPDGRIADVRIFFDPRAVAPGPPASGPVEIIVGETEAELEARLAPYRSHLREDIRAGRASWPPARDDAEAVRHADTVVVLEGLPRDVQERPAEGVVEVDGGLFYAEEHPLAEAEPITELLSDRRSVALWEYPKKCGGFHADYLIRWGISGERYEAQLCFGCGEMKWTTPNGRVTRYDVSTWADATLQTLLRRYRRHPP